MLTFSKPYFSILIRTNFKLYFRIADFLIHLNTTIRVYRHVWSYSEPRLLSAGFISLAYIGAFIRSMSFFGNSRWLEPLRISLVKMLMNVIQFMFIFALLLFAFALGLSELYWHHGAPQAVASLCAMTNNTLPSKCKTSVPFSSFTEALKDLFWTLFGYLDLNDINNNGQKSFNDYFAVVLLGSYHVVVIVVLINMLIAMMSQSYEETNSSEEVEWLFYRTCMWIRLIRADDSKPPPMNLVPNFYSIWLWMKRSSKRLRSCSEYKDIIDRLKVRIKSIKENEKETKLTIFQTLLERYKRKHIFQDLDKESLFQQCYLQQSSTSSSTSSNNQWRFLDELKEMDQEIIANLLYTKKNF